MQARLFSILPALAAVAFLGFGIAHADDAKDTKAPEAKKGCDATGCKDDKAATKDGAKKEEECEDGCCSKPAAKVSAKQLACADCEKASGTCDKCKAAVKSGAVAVLPVKGMMCSSCENGLAKKIDGVEQVAKFLVSSQKNIAVLVIAPGKTLKLSELVKTLDGTKFAIDEESPLVGRVTFSVSTECCEKSGSCPMCDDGAKKEAVAKKAEKSEDCCEDVRVGVSEIKGVDKCSAIKLAGGEKAFTVELAEGSSVTLKQIREKVASFKKNVGDFVFVGAPAEEISKDGKKSSS